MGSAKVLEEVGADLLRHSRWGGAGWEEAPRKRLWQRERLRRGRELVPLSI